MINLARYKRLYFLGVFAFCVGCSSSNNTTPNDNGEVSQFFTGGSICVEGSNSVTATFDENGNLVPVESQNEDLIDCSRFPPTDLTTGDIQMTGSGSATVADNTIEFTGAFSVEFQRLEGEGSDHLGFAIALHDGVFREQRQTDSVGTERVDYGVYDASVALDFELYIAGGNELNGQTYDYSSADEISDTSLRGVNALLAPALAIDLDGDGIVTSLDEFFFVTAGSLTWVGSPPTVSLSFDLTLSDGRAVSGSYQGDVYSVELPAALK